MAGILAARECLFPHNVPFALVATKGHNGVWVARQVALNRRLLGPQVLEQDDKGGRDFLFDLGADHVDRRIGRVDVVLHQLLHGVDLAVLVCHDGTWFVGIRVASWPRRASTESNTL
jgi:hypothetical protein